MRGFSYFIKNKLDLLVKLRFALRRATFRTVSKQQVNRIGFSERELGLGLPEGISTSEGLRQ